MSVTNGGVMGQVEEGEELVARFGRLGVEEKLDQF